MSLAEDLGLKRLPDAEVPAYGRYAPNLSADALKLLAEINADLARLRSLERAPTWAAVAAAQTALPALAERAVTLAGMLPQQEEEAP